MLWLTARWTQDGPGIAKDAPRRRGMALFGEILLRSGWDLVRLNLLLLVLSLPVVTLPAAWAAGSRITLLIARDRNIYVLRDFCDAFRSRVWQASLFGLLIGLGLTVGLGASLTYARAVVHTPLLVLALAVTISATLFIAMTGIYGLVIQALRPLPLMHLLRWSALAALLKPLPALGVLAVNALLWLIHVLFYPISVLLPVMVNLSFGLFVAAFWLAPLVEDLLAPTLATETADDDGEIEA